jgi:hypothetical protein
VDGDILATRAMDNNPHTHSFTEPIPPSVFSTLQVRTTRKARADGAIRSSSSIVVVRHVKILVTQQPTISKSSRLLQSI